MAKVHCETDQSTSNTFVTLNPKGSMVNLDSSTVIRSLIGIFFSRIKSVSSSVVRFHIGLFAYRSKPVFNVCQHS